MKINKILKMLLIVMLFITVLDCTYNIVSAQATIDLFKGNASDDATGGGMTEARKIIGRIITLVQVVGTFIAVAMIMSLGIKYMVASPGDRAEIKQHLTTYVIGAVVFFGSVGILTILKRFFTRV